MNLHCHLVLSFEVTGADNLLCGSFSGTNRCMGSAHVLAIWVTEWWKSIFCFCHYCLSGQLLLSVPNPVSSGVSSNCATDFFHSWITPLVGFIITTSTSCCGSKYGQTVALHFVSLPEALFPFFSCFRHLSATYSGLQQMFRAFLCVSAECMRTWISAGITREAPQLGVSEI